MLARLIVNGYCTCTEREEWFLPLALLFTTWYCCRPLVNVASKCVVNVATHIYVKLKFVLTFFFVNLAASFSANFQCLVPTQITLISLRILVGYAKSTHRNLAQLCRVPYQRRPSPATATARPTSAPDGGNINDHAHANGEANSPSPPRSVAPSLFQVDDMYEVDQDDQDDKKVLPWDPLAPRLLEEAQRLAREGKDRPFTAAVVLAAALPFSGAAVFFGAPVLVGDAALQWGAGTPIGRTVGHGTRNAVEVS